MATSNYDNYIVAPLALTVDTAAYALGDVVGNLPATTPVGVSENLCLRNVNASMGRAVMIVSATVIDKGEQQLAATVHFFSSRPTGGTYVENGALILSSDDFAKVAGPSLQILSTGHVILAGTGGVGSVRGVSGLGAMYRVDERDLWVLIHADAVIDLVAAADIRILFGIDRGIKNAS